MIKKSLPLLLCSLFSYQVMAADHPSYNMFEPDWTKRCINTLSHSLKEHGYSNFPEKKVSQACTCTKKELDALVKLISDDKISDEEFSKRATMATKNCYSRAGIPQPQPQNQKKNKKGF